jgi:hypothetical protein
MASLYPCFIDIGKKQLRPGSKRILEMWRTTIKAEEAIKADENCPAATIDQIKTRKISSEYDREPDGVDVDSPEVLEDYLGC